MQSSQETKIHLIYLADSLRKSTIYYSCISFSHSETAQLTEILHPEYIGIICTYATNVYDYAYD